MGGTAIDDLSLDVSGARAARAFAPGERIGGRYQIVAFIAAGGMGEVYAADDLLLGGRVALKTLLPARAGSASAVERMRRELALARRITHPNVCRVHDLDTHDGVVFLTMELLEGETLAARVSRGPLAIAELEALAGQLIAGLAAAHAAGVVHRDLKPGNVLLVDGRAVITDFGLARAAGPDAAVALTGEASLIGTPAYMAPEQVEGRPATAASDVYALGAVLFELATGRPPFCEDGALATATARLQRPAPRAATLRADLPARWDHAITRCLARDPAARPAAVAVLGDEPPLGARARRRRAAVAAIGLAAVAAIGLAAAVLAATCRGAAPTAATAGRPGPARPWPASFRPAHPRAAVHVEAAQRALLDGDVATARDEVEQAAAAAPDDPIAEAALAEVLDGLGLEERARAAAARAIAGRAGLAAEPGAMVEAIAAAVRGDAAAALAAVRRLVALAPHERGHQLRLARHLAPTDPDAAAAALAAAGVGPDGPTADAIAHALVAAEIARARGDAAAMLRHADAALGRAAGRAHDVGAAHLLRASARWLVGDTAGARAGFRAAVTTGDSGAMVAAWSGLIELERATDQLGPLADDYLALVALLRTLGDRRRLLDVLEDAPWFLLIVGRLDAVEALLTEARGLAADIGDDADRAWIELFVADLALERGQPAAAASGGEAAVRAGLRLGVAGLIGHGFYTWAEALVELDDDAGLARARAVRGGEVELLADGFVALRRGDLDRAAAIAAPLVSPQTGEGREAAIVLARVAIARGDLDEADRRLAEVAPGQRGDGAGLLVRRRLVLGQAELRAARGHLDDAIALLDEQAAACAARGLARCAIEANAIAAGLACRAVQPAAGGRRRAAIAAATAHALRRAAREVQAACQVRR